MDGMDFTIPKKGSKQQDDQQPLASSNSETAAPQAKVVASKPASPAAAAAAAEKRKTPPSRPSTRGRLLPSAVNSKRSYIHIKSEEPFIIKINLSQVPLNNGGIDFPSTGTFAHVHSRRGNNSQG